ncbi:hypothetical protein CL629_04380 [bacterium]|nr:hypothetical protein [bacterium]|tara:strand:+ start:3573 stop:4406 length:834 start_codon:yes stop_codon:yes gene_type:complete
MKNWITKLLYLLQAILQKRDKACPYCLYSPPKIVGKKKKIIDICYCTKCHLYWTNPIFKEKNFYSRLYETESLSAAPLNEEDVRRLLRVNFSNSGKDFRKMLKWFKANSSGNKFLDFGSSWGYFLHQAKSFGFDATGVEISDKRAEFGRKNLGVRILPNIDALISEGEKFDIVFSSNVLEHIGHEIKDIFSKLSSVLKEDGLMVLEVPFFDMSRGKEIFSLMGAIHPLGFTEEFFTKNMPNYGLKAEVHYGYQDIVPGYKPKKDGQAKELVIVCKKS